MSADCRRMMKGLFWLLFAISLLLQSKQRVVVFFCCCCWTPIDIRHVMIGAVGIAFRWQPAAQATSRQEKKKQQKFSCTRCMFAVRFALLVSYIGSCYVVYAWNIYCVLYKHKHQSSFVTFGGWHTQQLSFRVTNHFSTNKNVRSASFLEEIMASCW